MELSISSEISINAPVEKVWNILMDFDNHPKWNPFFKYIKGTPKVGERIQVGIDGMTFKPTILKNEKRQELRWLGSLFFKGLFDGEHYFQLEDLGDNKTKLIHGEHFRGILVSLFKKKLLTNTQKGFESLNEALKNNAEG